MSSRYAAKSPVYPHENRALWVSAVSALTLFAVGISGCGGNATALNGTGKPSTQSSASGQSSVPTQSSATTTQTSTSGQSSATTTQTNATGQSSATTQTNASDAPAVSSSATEVRSGQTLALTATLDGRPAVGGQWLVLGGTANGSISSEGIFSAPGVLPTPNVVQVAYDTGQTFGTADVTVLNPIPIITAATQDGSITTSTVVKVSGSGFVSGSGALVNGVPVMANYVDANHLSVILPTSVRPNTQIAITNPNPGAAVSAPMFVVPALASSDKASGVVTLSASQVTLRPGQTATLSASQDGTTLTGGQWLVVGGGLNGTVDANGHYQAPYNLTNVGPVTVTYTTATSTASLVLSLVNAVPIVSGAVPNVIRVVPTPVAITGSGFASGAQVSLNGQVMPTTFVDGAHLIASLGVPASGTGSLALTVVNPGADAVVSNSISLSAMPSNITVSPAVLGTGNITLTVTGSGFTSSTLVAVNGRTFQTTLSSTTSLTAAGYLAPWNSGPISVSVLPASGASAVSETFVPLAPTAVSYDAAARFTTQAGFGPRPDLVQHVQTVGFQAFINEQMQQPGVPYTLITPSAQYLRAILQGPSVLRLRVAWALQNIFVNRGNSNSNSKLFWEETLEADAFGNFRQLMTDAASDPEMALFLNLTGNVAPSDPTQHPNQNFAREFMQLFTLGTVALNDDGSPQLTSTGTPASTYDMNTILDLSRALTGWNIAPPVNPATTVAGIDYSVKMIPTESQHDHGSKTLFGTITLPSGQSAEVDRQMALDAVFAQPSLPPYISRILIQRLTKSSPSPAYVSRITQVFKDDGTGVRGNLSAVITAILLDPEARAGDTNPSADDGYLQDPMSFELFAMAVLGQVGTDGQFIYIPEVLREDFWNPPNVFGFLTPSYQVPGTTINSPEFGLFDNVTILHRSQLLWGITTGQQSGFATNDSAWIYTTFPNVPDIVEALNHLVYHGRMPDAERVAIITYCKQLDATDLRTQLQSAVFLALNGDSYTVAQ